MHHTSAVFPLSWTQLTLNTIGKSKKLFSPRYYVIISLKNSMTSPKSRPRVIENNKPRRRGRKNPFILFNRIKLYKAGLHAWSTLLHSYRITYKRQIIIPLSDCTTWNFFSLSRLDYYCFVKSQQSHDFFVGKNTGNSYKAPWEMMVYMHKVVSVWLSFSFT